MRNSDEHAIAKIFEEELPAQVHAGNIDGYISLWGGADPMWCLQDAPDAKGIPAIRQAVTRLLATYRIDARFHADQAVALGDRGFVNGTSNENIQPTDGSPAYILNTREIWLFVKEAGDWRINCIVFNHKPS